MGSPTGAVVARDRSAAPESYYASSTRPGPWVGVNTTLKKHQEDTGSPKGTSTTKIGGTLKRGNILRTDMEIHRPQHLRL